MHCTFLSARKRKLKIISKKYMLNITCHNCRLKLRMHGYKVFPIRSKNVMVFVRTQKPMKTDETYTVCLSLNAVS